MSAKKVIPYKIYLEENELPKTWYNVRADMKNKPAPLLNPATLRPMTAADLAPVFCEELIKQELDNDTREYPIPQEIQDFYKMYTPRRWCGPTAWRKSSTPRQKFTTSSRATTPAAPTSSTPPSPRHTTPRSRA